jgi:hypothetical protein
MDPDWNVSMMKFLPFAVPKIRASSSLSSKRNSSSTRFTIVTGALSTLDICPSRRLMSLSLRWSKIFFEQPAPSTFISSAALCRPVISS